MKFTDDQQAVIDTRNKNILVSAAAGSGKTAVLVERIVDIVCDEKNGVDIDNFLVVTFTRAAAAEMRERIHKRIAEKMEENPGNSHLEKQYSLVHRAQITTIDAFCQNLLKNHFQEIGADPDFRVMDAGEEKLLKRDVIGDLLEEKYAEGEEKFIHVTEFFAAKKNNDADLEELIIKISDFAESFDRPDKFLLKLQNDSSDMMKQLETGEIGKFFLKFLKETVSYCADEYRKLVNVCDAPDGPYMFGELIEKECSMLEKLPDLESPEKIGDGIRLYKESLESLPRTKDKNGTVDPDKREYVKNSRTELKKKLNGLVEDYFEPSLKEKALICDKCSDDLKELINLVLAFRDRFEEAKKLKKLVNFADVEHYALDILLDENDRPTETALELRDHFAQIMVDEYQDSNLIQEKILTAIAKNGMEHDGTKHYDSFMVGDVKQSIYGFRQARPDLFNTKFNEYPHTEGCRRIDLSKNFRSRNEVLDSVNDVFEKIMNSANGGIEYNEEARLNYGADYYNINGAEVSEEEKKILAERYCTELILFDGDRSGELSEKCGKKADTGLFEAEAVANIINSLIAEKFQVTYVDESDSKKERCYRDIEYKDIVILHRSPKDFADTVREVFEKRGIPVSIEQGGGYFDVPEVSSVLQYIKAIDNPLIDISFYGALVSYFGGFSTEEVASLRASYPADSLYGTIKAAAEDGKIKEPAAEADKIEEQAVKNPECLKAAEFLRQLGKYRNKASYTSISELLTEIYDDHGYAEYVSALPGGSRRKANVLMLLKYAQKYETTSYYGLYNFVKYIDQLKKYMSEDIGEADSNSEAVGVKLMSIHKSKGLEFPVTILAGAGHGFNDNDLKKNVICHNILGIGCNYVSVGRRTKTGTISHSLIAGKIKEEARAEELRLLYVAMTRAKEKLFIVGNRKNAEEELRNAENSNSGVLTYSEFLSAGCYLDFLLPVIGGCRINAGVISPDEIKEYKSEEKVLLAERRKELETPLQYVDETLKKTLLNRFSYSYPYRYLEKLYTKTTVSELKIAAMTDEDEAAHDKFESRENEIYVPCFIKEKERITGTTRGDAYHRVMEIMNFDIVLGNLCGGVPESTDKMPDKKDIINNLTVFLQNCVTDKRLKKEYFDAVNPGKIADFLRSPLALRMWQSFEKGGLRREQPFMMRIAANKVEPEMPVDEKMLVQGIADAYFEENGGIVLIDYKTDSLDEENAFVKRYHTQLDYYCEAIEKLTGKKVTERILYSFHLGKEIQCPW